MDIPQCSLATRSWLRCGMVLVLALGIASGAVAQEICDNGIDDTGNGLIDLNDVGACPCVLAPPVTNIIPNGSFEDHDCCPEGFHDYLECATGWLNYMESSTAEFFNCDFMPTAVPEPFPNGSGATGFGAFTDWAGSTSYYEFLMTCLSAPMPAGEVHELRFNMAAARVQFFFPPGEMIQSSPLNMGPIDMAIYGLASCPSQPYVFYDPVFGNPLPATICPTDLGWTELGHVTYNPATTWEELAFSFTPPFEVQAIMFGPTCPVPLDYISYQSTWPYFFLDDMRLTVVSLDVEHTGHLCTNDLLLSAVPYDPGTAQYQWYRNGVALVGQTAGTLDVSGLGSGEATYQIRAVGSSGCLVASYDVEVEWPVPEFSTAPVSGCAPLEVTFTNTTATPIGTSLWDLGDGTTSTAVDVLHSYVDPGTFDVGLSITSPQGCTKDTLLVGLINVFAMPVAAFTVDTALGCPGLEVSFENMSGPMAGLACVWDLGDGASLADCDGTHVYSTSGSYDVRLTVSTPEGCVDDTLIVGLVEILPVPTPAFSIDPSSGCVPLVVRFENLTPDAASQSPFWDLGNGQTSTSTNVITTYTDPGTYSVSLTMTNTIGCSATLAYADTIVAYGLPVVVFSVLPDSGCAPLFVDFMNTTDPAMVGSCAWDFGDGGSSGSCNTTHTYTDPGSYTVSLYVSSPTNCDGDTTVHHLVNVFPAPTAQFTMTPQPTDLYATDLEFTDGSSADVMMWDWSFTSGVPSSSDLPTPSVTFPYGESGSYLTTLIVTNSYGCVDTATASVRIDGVFSVFVPNTFSPNGDGVNDLFIPIVQDAATRDYSFLIFDRWGQEIFSTTSIGTGWDGTVNGAEPKTDVYAWRVRVRSDVDSMMREYAGHVTVLR